MLWPASWLVLSESERLMLNPIFRRAWLVDATSV
jgi:hypothetical protein